MDVSSVSSATSATSADQVSQQAGILTLRKAMDAEQSAALQLIQSIQAPQPDHLGTHVDLLA